MILPVVFRQCDVGPVWPLFPGKSDTFQCGGNMLLQVRQCVFVTSDVRPQNAGFTALTKHVQPFKAQCERRQRRQRLGQVLFHRFHLGGWAGTEKL